MSACSVNWCQHWFEYFPNPPLNILSMAENVLAHHDKELLQHLVDCGITSQVEGRARGSKLSFRYRKTVKRKDTYVSLSTAAVFVAPVGDVILRGSNT